MNKSVSLTSKVKAEMVILREIIAYDTDSEMVSIARDLLAKNKAWLDEWKAQDSLAMINNCKK
tara:strand:- start:2029 stop:2217 length:189 start_codon:yes stop_codon:yes gene_type:complete